MFDSLQERFQRLFFTAKDQQAFLEDVSALIEDGVPINQAAKKIMNDWNPAKDEAEGNQCKAYGAAAIMRVPGRVHITWQDDNTLKVDADAGMQTRVLRFGAMSVLGGVTGAILLEVGKAPGGGTDIGVRRLRSAPDTTLAKSARSGPHAQRRKGASLGRQSRRAS